MPLSDRLAEMAATVEAMGAPMALNPMLRILAERARELLDADFAAISTFGESGNMERFVYVGIDEKQARLLGEPPSGRGLLGALVNHERPLRLDDLRSNASFTGWPEGHPPMAAFLGVPMRSAGRTIGSFYMTRLEGRHPFDEADQVTAAILALQATAGVAGALVREREARVSVLEERERIARDLHDGTIQTLYALGLSFSDASLKSMVPEVKDALEDGVTQINTLIEDIRSYIGSLEDKLTDQPLELAKDIPRTVQKIVPEGVTTLVNVRAEALHDLPAREAEDILSIVREGLANAVRRGAATKVAVDLLQTEWETVLTIQDNGDGFDAGDTRHAMGWASLRTRAERLGGRLSVIAIPGMGTTIHLTVSRG